MPHASEPCSSAGILGCGHSLPTAIRHNDDPVFNRLPRDPGSSDTFDTVSFFTGSQERRHLSDGETIEPHMADAALQALAQAGIGPESVDRLYGYASVPDHTTPNSLYRVHHMLGLPREALVVPINSEFSNFLASLVLATEAVATGGARHVLIACGSNWTRHLDYAKGHAFAMRRRGGCGSRRPHRPVAGSRPSLTDTQRPVPRLDHVRSIRGHRRPRPSATGCTRAADTGVQHGSHAAVRSTRSSS